MFRIPIVSAMLDVSIKLNFFSLGKVSVQSVSASPGHTCTYVLSKNYISNMTNVVTTISEMMLLVIKMTYDN